MVLYFSGTGNSRFVAESLCEILDETCLNITRTNPFEVSFAGKYLIFVFPIYSWGVPPIVNKFIEDLSEKFITETLTSDVRISAVCTCGDETGMAPKLFEKTAKKRGFQIGGIWSVIMPNTYVLLPGFDVDTKEIEKDKLKKAPARIKDIADKIKTNDFRQDYIAGKNPHLKTRLVFPLFKKWGIFPNKWYWTEKCISCGKCSGVCPVNNIEMKGGHPQWGENCLSCLVCYHICPVKAIEYGKLTKHKGQYICPL